MLHEGDEGRATAGGQEALFGQFAGLLPGGEIRSLGGLGDEVEAQFCERRDHAPHGELGILCGDGRRNDGVDAVLSVFIRTADQVDDLGEIGFVCDCAEGAVGHAGAAGDALFLVDAGLAGVGDVYKRQDL